MFFRGAQPYPSISHSPISIVSVQDANAFLRGIRLTNQELYRYIQNSPSLAGLLNNEADIRSRFAELLVNKEILVYKIPVQTAASTAKAAEFVPATAADKPVPLAPEAKTKPAITPAQPTITPAPQSLDDCAQGLIVARKKLDAEGYKA